MITEKTLADLQARIQAQYCLIFLATWEEDRWESELANIVLDLRQGLVTWSMTHGFQPPVTDSADVETDPVKVLSQIEQYPRDHVFLLKDFHPYLKESRVSRKLRDLLGTLRTENKTLLLMSPQGEVPEDLIRDAVRIELPFPDIDDLRQVFADLLREHEKRFRRKFAVTEDEADRMLKAVVGLSAREASKALTKSMLGREKVDDEVYSILVSEKKSMLQGSDLLEFYDLSEGMKDIGGLEGLKEWLKSRATAYSEKARKAGLPMPRGMLLLGVQGCGKSLTARAAARLLCFPLVRLDVSALLSSDRGSSERNMRDVLQSIESMAPVILWMDEVEKAFGGVGDQASSDGTLTRIFGTFLTWMQDHDKPVFVIATANSVASLPPEMLRRGRFDELFFVNLPNYHERKDIFNIHMGKRKLDPTKFDIHQLSNKTEGYSGAEIEQIVKSAMYDAYTAGHNVTQEDLLEATEQTVPLSVTMEEKIFELREWARTRCRPATPDNRVMQMLEEESRRGE